MSFIKCQNCLAWRRNEQLPEKGRCMGEPPKAFPVMGQGMGGPQLAIVTAWPETGAGDGCLSGALDELALAAERQGVNISGQQGSDKPQ